MQCITYSADNLSQPSCLMSHCLWDKCVIIRPSVAVIAVDALFNDVFIDYFFKNIPLN